MGLFGNDNTAAPQQDDALRAAFASQNIGIKNENLPLGTGTYEIDRVYTDKSRDKGLPMFRARVVCVQHDDTTKVGKAYIWTCPLAGQHLQMTTERMTRFLICAFGTEARAQINSAACKEAMYNAHSEDYKTVVESQAFLGNALKGRKIKIDVVVAMKDGKPVLSKKGKVCNNDYVDCA
jgi:hypothetical protein